MVCWGVSEIGSLDIPKSGDSISNFRPPSLFGQAFADRKSGPKPAPDFLQKSSYPEDERSAYDDASGQVPLQWMEKDVPPISEFVKRVELNILSPELVWSAFCYLFDLKSYK